MDLKPCPFCGGKTFYEDQSGVVCDGCNVGNAMPGFIRKELWNTRPIEDKLRQESEKYKKVVEAVRNLIKNTISDRVSERIDLSELRKALNELEE
jgi:hypothetical protein